MFLKGKAQLKQSIKSVMKTACSAGIQAYRLLSIIAAGVGCCPDSQAKTLCSQHHDQELHGNGFSDKQGIGE